MIRRNLAWILLGLSLVLNIFFVGGFVYARHFGPPGGGDRGQWERRVDANWPGELKLDPGQQRTLRQSLREMRQRNAPRLRELAQVRGQLVAEMRKDKADVGAIDVLIDRATALRGEIQKDGFRTADRIAASLRPEQRDAFREAVIARTMGPGGGMRPGLRRKADEQRLQ